MFSLSLSHPTQKNMTIEMDSRREKFIRYFNIILDQMSQKIKENNIYKKNQEICRKLKNHIKYKASSLGLNIETTGFGDDDIKIPKWECIKGDDLVKELRIIVNTKLLHDSKYGISKTFNSINDLSEAIGFLYHIIDMVEKHISDYDSYYDMIFFISVIIMFVIYLIITHNMIFFQINKK